MSLFTWCESYSIDNEELDKHHRTLFNIMNRLYDSSFEHDNKDSFDTTIEELMSYSKYHFSAEEQYMLNIGYANIYEQIAEHEYFTRSVAEINRDKYTEGDELCRELIAFLGRWLLQHVIEVDKKIVI